MKNLLVVLLLIPFNLLSQSTSSFPESNTVWSIATIGMGIYMDNEKFGITGDTSINGLDYHKLGVSMEQVFIPQESSYYCAARSVGKQWYFVPDQGTTEYLMNDFNLSLGDTFMVDHPWAFGSLPLLVANVDSILTASNYRRRLLMQTYGGGYEEYWIEGIGSSNGLFYTGAFVLDLGWLLLCFEQNDTLMYLNSPNGECYFNELSSTELAQSEQITIFPNPAISEITVSGSEPKHIIICNLRGQVIISKTLIHDQETIDIRTLEPGLYIIHCQIHNNSIVSRKLILYKQDQRSYN
jgi:hypothetical protein